MPLAALNTAATIYLPRHFASHIGISLAAVGGAFATVRLIDIGVDLALGLLMDRTRTPWGRYRVWAIASAPVLMLAVWRLFFAPGGVGSGYLIGWLLVMYLGTSILALAHASWAANMAPTYRSRSRLFALIGSVGVAGSVLILLTPLVLEAVGAPESRGMVGMGVLLLVLFPIAVGLMTLRTPENVQAGGRETAFRLRDYWDVVARPTTSRILLADFCLALSPGWFSATYLFFFTSARGFSPGQANAMLAVAIMAGMLGAPLWGRLANRISKHRAVMVSTITYSAALAGMWLTPRGDLLVGYPVMFSAGFVLSGFNVLIRAMVADVGDELRLEQAKARTGLLYAMITMTTKVGTALAIFLTFNALARIGFNPVVGAANTPEVLKRMEVVSIAGPIAFALLGALCLVGYDLGEARHGDIRRELDARDAAETAHPFSGQSG